jgi:hypothetical protein
MQHELQLKQLEYKAKERAKQHELEMAKLQLQIEQAKAGKKTPAAINIIQQEDGFFKLEGPTNYESWYNEAFIQALAQALAIEAKHIIINKKNEGKLASPRPATDSTPTSDSTSSWQPPIIEESNDDDSPSKPNTNDNPEIELKNDDDTIRVIPRDTAILDLIPKVVGAEAVGAAAIKKKKDLNSLPSRANVPKTRCGWSKKQSIIDPIVRLAQDLINSINQEKTSDAWFCTFLANPNANQWQAALEGG